MLAFAALAADGHLKEWHTNIRHAAAGQMLARRDDLFRHPASAALKAALSGAAPANAADLKAVALEELQWLAQDLRTGSTSPWKSYWNRDAHGRATEPLIENERRNHLLERLIDRLRPYSIAAAFAEAMRGSAGRCDMLIVSRRTMDARFLSKPSGTTTPISGPQWKSSWWATLAGLTRTARASILFFGSDRSGGRCPKGLMARLSRQPNS